MILIFFLYFAKAVSDVNVTKVFTLARNALGDSSALDVAITCLSTPNLCKEELKKTFVPAALLKEIVDSHVKECFGNDSFKNQVSIPFNSSFFRSNDSEASSVSIWDLSEASDEFLSVNFSFFTPEVGSVFLEAPKMETLCQDLSKNSDEVKINDYNIESNEINLSLEKKIDPNYNKNMLLYFKQLANSFEENCWEIYISETVNDTLNAAKLLVNGKIAGFETCTEYETCKNFLSKYQMRKCLQDYLARSLTNYWPDNFEENQKNLNEVLLFLKDVRYEYITPRIYNLTSNLAKQNFSGLGVCLYSRYRCQKFFERQFVSYGDLPEKLARENECKLGEISFKEITSTTVDNFEIAFQPLKASSYCTPLRVEKIILEFRKSYKKYLETLPEDEFFILQAEKRIALILRKILKKDLPEYPIHKDHATKLWQKSFKLNYPEDLALCDIPIQEAPDFLDQDSVMNFAQKYADGPEPFHQCRAYRQHYFRMEYFASARSLIYCKNDTFHLKFTPYTLSYVRKILFKTLKDVEIMWREVRFPYTEAWVCQHGMLSPPKEFS